MRKKTTTRDLVQKIKQDQFTFASEATQVEQHRISRIAECEFLTLSPNNNVISVRSSDQEIELLAASSLQKVASIAADQAKCICTTQSFVFTGAWNGVISVFDVQKGFRLVKQIRCKQAVRAITQLDQSTLIIGENEGWFELLRVA